MMEYDIKFRDGYFEITLSGPADVRVYGEYMAAVLTHNMWAPGKSVLIDQSELDTGGLSVNDVKVIADQSVALKTEIGAIRLALLVGRDLEFGMNRMWGAFVDDKWDVVFELFRSRVKAIDWLQA